MSAAGQVILFEREIGKNAKVKIIAQQESKGQRLLQVEREGKVLYLANIDTIFVKDNNVESGIVEGKEVAELITNEETQITLTQDHELRIKLKDREISWRVINEQAGQKIGEKEKDQSDVEERVMKLIEIVKVQVETFNIMEKNVNTILARQADDIALLKSELSSTKEQLSVARLTVSSLQKQLSSLEETLNPLVTQQEEFKCFHHPYNPHSHHFTLRLTPHSLRIIKTSDNTFHNFISSLPILPSRVTTFRIRQVRVIDGEVFIGVGTRSVFGDINSWNRDFLSYYSGDGDVCENGLYHEGGEQIQDGETVTVRVDLISQSVSWWLQTKQLAQAKLPEQMRGKQLYLVLLMKHKGDELDLLID